MKRSKLGMFVAGLFMASLICFAALGLTGCGNTDTIAIVAKGESHAFWQSVKKGAIAAGEEFGYKITFVGPPNESPESIPKQKEQIQTALSSNPKGLGVATIGTGFVDLLKQASDKKIPVVQFDSGVWKEDLKTLNDANKNPILSSVATSNELAAALAAQNFYDSIKADITGAYKIGIIQHDTTQTGTDRTKGFEDKIKALASADSKTITIEKEIKDGDANQNYKTALEALNGKGVNAIFMTNEGVVKQVYDAVFAAGTKYDAIKFCGYDAGTKQIEWMKKTTGAKLVGAVAQDSYAIGYKTVEQIVNAIKGETVNKSVAIAGTWWTSSNVDELMSSGILYEG